MTGWASRKSVAERIEATRIPDELACPGSLQPRTAEGKCAFCGIMVGRHYPNGQAHKHKLVGWARERANGLD